MAEAGMVDDNIARYCQEGFQIILTPPSYAFLDHLKTAQIANNSVTLKKQKNDSRFPSLPWMFSSPFF